MILICLRRDPFGDSMGNCVQSGEVVHILAREWYQMRGSCIRIHVMHAYLVWMRVNTWLMIDVCMLSL